TSMRSIGTSINSVDNEEVVDVKKALLESISSLQWRIDVADISFVQIPLKGTLFTHGNFVRFKNILLSLITNSLEAVEGEKNRSVRVCVQRFGKYGVITVGNTGKKISGKSLRNLFNLFYSSKPSGNGLGLFI